eukprot:GHVL01035048.1.p1 GENE.GHVL01035048.1~~GHVL01035048.1.p1  ORF type:complete len:565 (-),score=163.50 GHVL01035048.1:2985-4637(-)
MQVDEFINKWKKFDIPTVIVEFEKFVNQIQTVKTESITSRKALAEKTKSFKILEPSEQINEIEHLIKSYQMELDSLVKRSGLSEKAFLYIYTSLTEVPDPLYFVEKNFENLSDLKEKLQMEDIEKKNSKEEIAGLQKTIENKSESIKRLEQEKSQLNNLMQSEEETKNYLKKELSSMKQQLLTKESEVESSVEEMRKSQNREETILAEKTSEMEYLTLEIERLETDNRRLKRSVEEENSAESTKNSNKQLQEMRIQIEELMTEISNLKNKNKKYVEDISVLEGKKEESDKSNLLLIEDLKKKIKNSETVALCDVKGASTDLEYRLISRQKELDSELSSYRTNETLYGKNVSDLNEKILNLNQSNADLKKLVSSLERQLLSTSNESDDKSINNMPSTSSKSDDKSTNKMPSMLEIVTAQRDRFRQTLLELEQERDRYREGEQSKNQIIESLKSEIILLTNQLNNINIIDNKNKIYKKNRKNSYTLVNDDLENGGFIHETAENKKKIYKKKDILYNNIKNIKKFPILKFLIIIYILIIHFLIFICIHKLAMG